MTFQKGNPLHWSKLGFTSWNKGKKCPQIKHEKQFKKGQTPWNKGLTKTDERIRKYAENGSKTKKQLVKDGRLKGGFIKGYDERRVKTQFENGHKVLDEWKESYKEKLLIRLKEGKYNRKPNKKEQFLDSLIQSNFPNQFIYSGDGKVVFPCGCPDFWNVNGQKKVILFHGLYWHLLKPQKKNPNLTREQVEQHDIEKYKQYGLNALIIWEDELENKEGLMGKIKCFMTND